jgi:hypothetical protein
MELLKEVQYDVNCRLLHYEALKRSSAWMGYCTVLGCTWTHTTVSALLKVYTLEIKINCRLETRAVQSDDEGVLGQLYLTRPAFMSCRCCNQHTIQQCYCVVV